MKTKSAFKFHIVFLLAALLTICAGWLLLACGSAENNVRSIILISIDRTA